MLHMSWSSFVRRLVVNKPSPLGHWFQSFSSSGRKCFVKVCVRASERFKLERNFLATAQLLRICLASLLYFVFTRVFLWLCDWQSGLCVSRMMTIFASDRRKLQRYRNVRRRRSIDVYPEKNLVHQQLMYVVKFWVSFCDCFRCMFNS